MFLILLYSHRASHWLMNFSGLTSTLYTNTYPLHLSLLQMQLILCAHTRHSTPETLCSSPLTPYSRGSPRHLLSSTGSSSQPPGTPKLPTLLGYFLLAVTTLEHAVSFTFTIAFAICLLPPDWKGFGFDLGFILFNLLFTHLCSWHTEEYLMKKE